MRQFENHKTKFSRTIIMLGKNIPNGKLSIRLIYYKVVSILLEKSKTQQTFNLSTTITSML